MPEGNARLGPPVFYIGLIAVGIATAISISIPPVVLGLWLIISGLLLLIGR